MKLNLKASTRFFLFIAGIFFTFILSYKMAINNTITLISENKHLLEHLDSVKQGSAQLDMLKLKLDKIKNSIGTTSNPNTDIHQEILNTCSRFCIDNSLLIREYPEKETVEYGSSKSEINKITIDGSFCKALQLVYNCEKNKNLGRVVSVQFEKQKDLYAQKERLYTTVYFQNIVSE
jgi:hypothetical protein